jgi:hypothetical protein
VNASGRFSISGGTSSSVPNPGPHRLRGSTFQPLEGSEFSS